MKLLIKYFVNLQCYFARQLFKHKVKYGVNKGNREIKGKVLFNEGIVTVSSAEKCQFLLLTEFNGMADCLNF